MEDLIQTRSGTPIPCITPEQADNRHLLSKTVLDEMHLTSKKNPVAYSQNADGSCEYYFDPQTVIEAPAEEWYRKPEPKKPEIRHPKTLPDGRIIGRMGAKLAASFGYYTKPRLDAMNYDVVAGPVAYNYRNDHSLVYYYDKAEAIRRPLLCVRCGKLPRYRKKMCESCYEAEMEKERREGDLLRSKCYHMKREKVLFFDLELTGVYDHDEILSISIVDGNGKIIMDTLVKPARKKKWKQTEAIHGITPQMVENSPSLKSLIPEIKSIFADCENLIAYGISTDFSHIKKIYDNEKEQEKLHAKIRCAANEFRRFAAEHHPEQLHFSLTDAMALFEIPWDGVAHTSIADTIGCAKLWEKLFPNYYED